jgi:carbonic anhydrase
MVSFTDMLEGYHRFRETGWANQRTKWDELSAGQSPRVMVIACSDSRVDPTQIFDTNPGEMFVVRNVAALVPPFETSLGYHGVSAALEFAVQILEVEEVVVMGHGLCGGCKAALTRDLHDAPQGAGGFIASWISMLDGARDQIMAVHDDPAADGTVRAMEQAAVKVSLDNLRTFPWIGEKEAAGRLRLKGAYFAITDGILHLLDEDSGHFSPYE